MLDKSMSSYRPTPPSSCIHRQRSRERHVADGANTPFRSQKDTNWKAPGACGVHPLARRIKGGSSLNASCPPGHAADAGCGGRRSGHQPEAVNGYKVGSKTFRVPFDGGQPACRI